MRARCGYAGCDWEGPDRSGKAGEAQASQDLLDHGRRAGHIAVRPGPPPRFAPVIMPAIAFLVPHGEALFGVSTDGATFRLCMGAACPYYQDQRRRTPCETGRVWHEVAAFDFAAGEDYVRGEAPEEV